MADISNGEINQNTTKNTITLSSFNSPTTPAQVIPQRIKEQTQVDQFVFPLEKPKYFMNLGIGDYSFLTRSATISSYIRLPMPDKVRDVNSTSFNQTPLSAFVGTTVEAVGATAKSVSDNIQKGEGFLKTTSDAIATMNQGVAKTTAAAAYEVARTGVSTVGSAIGLADMGGQLIGLGGYAPNQFLTVMLKGPQFKKYSFSWVLSPDNPQEAVNIKNIIKTLNKSRATDLTGMNLFFKFPKIFQLSFKPDDEYLYQFKPAVMEHFVVDYFGGRAPSFLKANASTNNKNPPESVIITASFLELEFWLAKDY